MSGNTILSGDETIVKVKVTESITQRSDAVIANRIFENLGDENVDHNGGGIYITSGATVSLVNCDFTGNYGVRGGGVCIYATETVPATVNIDNCYFANNTATEGTTRGNDIFVYKGSTVTLSNSTVLGQITIQGPCLFTFTGTITLGNTSLDSANSSADCFKVDNAHFVFTNAETYTFRNIAKLDTASAGIVALTFNNTAKVTAANGCDFSNVKTVTIGNQMTGTIASNFGTLAADVDVVFGGSTVKFGQVTALEDKKVLGVAKNNSGTISVKTSDLLTLRSSYYDDFSRTDFVDGYQGRVLVTGGTHTISGAVFQGNSSTDRGGALSVGESAVVTLENCRFLNNYSDNRGGAVGVYMANVTIKNCYFEGNSNNSGDQQSGDLALISSGTATISDTVLNGGIFTQSSVIFTGNITLGNGYLRAFGDWYSSDNASFTFTNTTAQDHYGMQAVEGKKGVVALDFRNTAKVSFGHAADFSDVETISVSGNMTGTIGSGFTTLNTDADVIFGGVNTEFGRLTLVDNNKSIGKVNFANGSITVSKGELKLAETASGDLTRTEFVEGYQGRVTVSGGTHTISNATLSGNSVVNHGGAVNVATDAELHLENCTISGNFAGGAESGNGYNGGAIFSKGDLYINNCTISGNSAQYRGGALYVSGFTDVKNTVFADNSAGNNGYEIFVSGAAAVLNVQDSTLSNMMFNQGTVTLKGDITLAGGYVFNKNDAGIYNGDNVHFIFANTTEGSQANHVITNKGVTALTFNNTAAINFRYNDAVASDAFSNVETITIGGQMTGKLGGGFGSLNADANVIIGDTKTKFGEVTVMDSNTLGQASYTASSGTINFQKETGSLLTMVAADTDDSLFTVDKFVDGWQGRVNVSSGTHTISGAAISDNFSADHGGAVISDNTNIVDATFENSSFSGNTANRRGGAMFLKGAVSGDTKFTISGCTFSGNTACGADGADDHIGGAIYYQNSQGKLIIDGSEKAVVFDSNIADYGGGALWVREGVAELTGDVRFLTASDSINIRENCSLAINNANITLNADLTSRKDSAEAAGTLISVADSTIAFGGGMIDVSALNIGSGVKLIFNGETVNFVNQDLSAATITVNSCVDGDIIAENVSKIGAYSLADKTFTLALVDGKVTVSKMAEKSLTGNTVGTESNLITSGEADNFIANKTAAAENLLTTIKGGAISNALVGGAYAKFAEVGKAVIGNVELNISDLADIAGKVYAGGYLYGNGADSAEAQMTVDEVNITIDGGAVSNNMFGGAHAREYGYALVDTVNITVTDGSHGRIYAGGWAEKGAVSYVTTANVTISGGTVDYLYGGGANADGETYVTTSNITIENDAVVNTIFMGGRYGYSWVENVNLTFAGENKELTRLSGVSSAGMDYAKATVVELATNVTADLIDYVDKFVINEDCTLTANDAFYLGNRLENGETDGFTTFDFIAEGKAEWTAVAGIDDFTNAKFAVNGSEAQLWDGSAAIKIGGYELTYNAEDKTIKLAQITA